MQNIKPLNERQVEAVNWESGAALVLAGPGSGKTTVLTSRIIRLLHESQNEHFKILGLTFTNKAASEMKKRVDEQAPTNSHRVMLSTFHSFAGDILRQHGHLIGLNPDFTIMTQEGERTAILDLAIIDAGFGGDRTEYSGEKLLPIVTRILEKDVEEKTVTDDDFASENNEQFRPIWQIYKKYRQRMILENSLDFGGIIAESIRLLREKNAVRKQLQRVYKFVCVDEFQDTNLSQYNLLKLVTNDETKNLFVVADDDQILYQWNGASPERLSTLINDYSMTTIQLPANYRCPIDVIEKANLLIAHNSNRTPNKEELIARKSGNHDCSNISVHKFTNFELEASWIADNISGLDVSTRTRCVVLARTRKPLETIVEKLKEYGVNAYLANRKDEFVSSPLIWMHSVLKVANSPNDKERIRMMCKSFYELEGIQISPFDVRSSSQSMGGSSLKAFKDLVVRREGLSGVSRNYLENILSSFSENLEYRSFCTQTLRWFDEITLSDQVQTESFNDFVEELQTWNELLKDIEDQYGAASVTLGLLLQELDMRSKAPNPAKDAVPCLTVHASKGMEFGHVYLVAMVEDQLPSFQARNKGDKSREMQEERRNCFVAITRTEETLTITYSENMYGYRKIPSRFLIEMKLI